MGNGILPQTRLINIPTSTNLLKSPTRTCQVPQSPSDVNFELPAVEVGNVVIDGDQSDPQGESIPSSDFLDIEQNMPGWDIKDFVTEYPQVDGDEQGKYMQTKFSSSSCDKEYKRRLKSIQETLRSLGDSLHETRGLENEKSFRYSQLKTKNMILQIDLDKAEKRNKNMLNLFRQNAAEISFGRLRTSSTLPESLRKDIQRIWSQKYDALLEQNNQLKKEAADAKFALKNKDKEVEDLQLRLLNLAEELIQREKTIEKICTKFISLKQRKDEQEILLRGSVETLQDALQKVDNNTNVSPSKSESSMIPCKNALIAREIRRNDRLAYENVRLKALLQEAKRSCRSSRTSSTISLCEKRM